VDERLRFGGVPVLAKLGRDAHRAPLPGSERGQEAPQALFAHAVGGRGIEIAHAEREGCLQQRARLALVRNLGMRKAPGLADADQSEAEFHARRGRESHRWLRYHSSVIRIPSSNEYRGAWPRSRTASVVSAWESRTSPARGGPQTGAMRTPSSSCSSAHAWLSVILSPLPPLYMLPETPWARAAFRLSSATSSTNVKSRECSPSPKMVGAWRSSTAFMNSDSTPE